MNKSDYSVEALNNLEDIVDSYFGYQYEEAWYFEQYDNHMYWIDNDLYEHTY